MRYGTIVGIRQVDALVYFGRPVHEFTAGLEALYEDLMAMEVLLLIAAQAAPGVRRFECTETILDDDRVDSYKLMAMRRWCSRADQAVWRGGVSSESGSNESIPKSDSGTSMACAWVAATSIRS